LDFHLIGLKYSKSEKEIRKREGKVTAQKTEVDTDGTRKETKRREVDGWKI
jgi:hypothetical protein